MAQISLNDIFSKYTSKKPIFKDKDTLSIRFTPENIPHRSEQINQLAHILAPVLRNEKPSNVFIYGKTGTGKTLIAKKVAANLEIVAEPNNLKIIYINCKMRKVTDTEYRLLAQLIEFFGEKVPYTGLPTSELYNRFFRLLDASRQNVVLVLDEIDSLVDKIGSLFLYNLTRINQDLEKTKITLVGISNNISFLENLDSRVKSSLSEEELIFPPYNATEIKDILTERSRIAFHPETITDAAIAKCAALAAQEHGDARKAIDLLRVAGETAERIGSNQVREEHVDIAQNKVDTDRYIETIHSQPKQSKIVLKAVLELYKKNAKGIQTGDVYDLYAKICQKNNIKSLTQRRVSDLITELDNFGIISTVNISKGRYGRTRKINVNLSGTVVSKIEEMFSKEL
ncbi:MAG: orc1/cdc6 family replication initiation protein [Candidatus Aenigmarchaeota archaeon]|nr:orc1/cdc6 family replication initiation protein [Candidatus Aenigmarchaeota archaeon]